MGKADTVVLLAPVATTILRLIETDLAARPRYLKVSKPS